MDVNNLMVTGELIEIPTLIRLERSNSQYCLIRINCKDTRDREDGKASQNLLELKAWGRLGEEVLKQNFQVGQKIVASGRLSGASFDGQGTRKYIVSVSLDTISGITVPYNTENQQQYTSPQYNGPQYSENQQQYTSPQYNGPQYSENQQQYTSPQYNGPQYSGNQQQYTSPQYSGNQQQYTSPQYNGNQQQYTSESNQNGYERKNNNPF